VEEVRAVIEAAEEVLALIEAAEETE